MQMTKHYGFSLKRAADHPNCPSATEFYEFLVKLERNDLLGNL
jgi:hypothetical protein